MTNDYLYYIPELNKIIIVTMYELEVVDYINLYGLDTFLIGYL
jgi:hypothetical protein